MHNKWLHLICYLIFLTASAVAPYFGSIWCCCTFSLYIFCLHLWSIHRQMVQLDRSAYGKRVQLTFWKGCNSSFYVRVQLGFFCIWVQLAIHVFLHNALQKLLLENGVRLYIVIFFARWVAPTCNPLFLDILQCIHGSCYYNGATENFISKTHFGLQLRRFSNTEFLGLRRKLHAVDRKRTNSFLRFPFTKTHSLTITSLH